MTVFYGDRRDAPTGSGGPESVAPFVDGAKGGIEKPATELPNALNKALDDVSLDDAFFDTAFRAARQAGYELLFEIPSVLLSDPEGRVAAIRCGAREDCELFFILFNAASGAISVIEGTDVPEPVLDFTRSYAGVLSLIGNDRRLVAPLLQ